MRQQATQQSLIQPANFNKLSQLLGCYVVVLCISLSFANNLNSVLGLTLPGGVYVFPFTFILCDVVSDVYGFKAAKNFIWVGIVAQLVFAVLAELLLLIPNPTQFEYGQAYQTVFEPTLGFVISGILGFALGEYCNVYVMAKLKIRMAGRYFIFRSIVTTALGQALLTIVVDLLVFSNKLSSTKLMTMMLSAWSLKMGCCLVLVTPAWLLVKYLKKTEKVDIYDTETDFNPFKLK